MSLSLERLGTLLRGFEGARKPPVSVGLEMGEEFLRGVILKKGVGGGYSLAHAAEWTLPKEEEERETTLTQAITALKDKAGANPTPEWFGTVQEGKVCLRLIRIPRVPHSEMKGAVMWEARNHVPFPLDRSFIDYQIFGETEEEGEAPQYLVMLAAAQQEVIQKRLEQFQRHGIRLSGLSLPAALIWNGRKQLTKPSDREAFALVNVDHGKTILCVGKGALLEFTREILLTKRYPVSHKTAADHPLIRELRRSFDYYQERHKGEKVKNIFLSGGGGSEEGLAELLSATLQVSVEAIDPFRKLGFRGEDLAVGGREGAGRSAAFTVATVAALVAGGINLLPPRLRPRKPFPLQKALIPAAALILALLGYNYWSLGVSEGKYRNLLQTRQGEVVKFRADREQLTKLRKKEQRLKEFLAQLPASSAESLPWKDLFGEMARLLPQNILLQRMTFESKKESDKGNGQSGEKRPSSQMKGKLEGVIFGNEAEALAGLAEVMEALKGTGRFEGVRMSAPVEKNSEFDTPGVNFGVDFDVVVKNGHPKRQRVNGRKG